MAAVYTASVLRRVHIQIHIPFHFRIPPLIRTPVRIPAIRRMEHLFPIRTG
jgi:hypothetical protein